MLNHLQSIKWSASQGSTESQSHFLMWSTPWPPRHSTLCPWPSQTLQPLGHSGTWSSWKQTYHRASFSFHHSPDTLFPHSGCFLVDFLLYTSPPDPNHPHSNARVHPSEAWELSMSQRQWWIFSLRSPTLAPELWHWSPSCSLATVLNNHHPPRPTVYSYPLPPIQTQAGSLANAFSP